MTVIRGSNPAPYNSDNQPVGSAFAYDGNGNPTTYRSAALTFDPENRMLTDAGSQTNAYSADGLRAWQQSGTKTSTRMYYLYDGKQPAIELTSTGAFYAANTFGADGLISRRTTGIGTICYLFDDRGNVCERTSSTGTVNSTEAYDSYGLLVAFTTLPSDPWQFGAQAGYYTDTLTGLVLCTHRYYDAQLGRFLTPDPMGYEGGINLYGYVGNNPGNRFDPSGYWPGDYNDGTYGGQVGLTGSDGLGLGGGAAVGGAFDTYGGAAGTFELYGGPSLPGEPEGSLEFTCSAQPGGSLDDLDDSSLFYIHINEGLVQTFSFGPISVGITKEKGEPPVYEGGVKIIPGGPGSTTAPIVTVTAGFNPAPIFGPIIRGIYNLYNQPLP